MQYFVKLCTQSFLRKRLKFSTFWRFEGFFSFYLSKAQVKHNLQMQSKWHRCWKWQTSFMVGFYDFFFNWSVYQTPGSKMSLMFKSYFENFSLFFFVVFIKNSTVLDKRMAYEKIMTTEFVLSIFTLVI